MLRPLLRLLPDLRPYRGAYTAVLVLTAVATVISLIIPVFVGWAIDGPIAHGDYAGLWLPVAAVTAIGLLEAAALLTRRMLAAPVSSRLEIAWRRRLYAHLQRMAVARHDSWESGQLLSRAVQDLSQLRRFVSFGAPFLLVTPLNIVVGLIILAVYSPVIALITLLCAVPTVVICTWLQRRFQLISRAVQDQNGELTTLVEESVQGIRIIKAFGRGETITARYAAQARRLWSTELERARLDAWLNIALILLPFLAIGVSLGYGTWQIVHGTMTPGALVAAITVMMFLRMPIEMLGFLLSDAYRSATAAIRHWEVVDTPIDITDPASPSSLPATDAPARVEFRDVRFRFPDAAADTLAGFSLVLEPGTTTALVGATGTGKTAVAALLPRLHDVTAGAVLLDGTDVRDLPLETLRRHVAVAFDEPILFSASVRENVALGSPEAGDDEVWAALEIAQAAAFVRELPDGLGTLIGEQGLSLSGGQRQRLSLARAILGRPRVLVLDDPLSAVDVTTEERVQEHLRERLRQSTALVIAHRPSTAALADRVAVLEGGRIVDCAPHAELLRRSPAYRSLMGARELRQGDDAVSAGSTP
ncbi:ABC transporter ATP-binding protein [Sediminivirga luteola]|uniref:ABC transporter ATP-binding protein n=1 Tax=Sediminivirga luteola TaxID=1774748 RepID=UPI001F583BB7|nr:ABC transporter ATP-binding protein [Sediminivirga luteola]MCI2265769.1 ABC transporter ATP-binding protein/permease [Sediminivirga luteola]